MNEYKFHIGDYRRDTDYFTIEEHGIYRYLLDELYLQETPLSTDIRYWIRKMRLTGDQKPLLEQILSEKFILTDDGYTHTRVSRELSRIYSVSAQATANINARWEAIREKEARNTPVIRPNNAGNTGDILPSNPVTQIPSNPKKNGRFAPPNQAEVTAYWQDKKLKGDPEVFHDHFSSNGWKVSGKAAMKDWKAAARNWSKREEKNETNQRTNRPAESHHAGVVKMLRKRIESDPGT